mgnify:CR=1 FL=1
MQIQRKIECTKDFKNRTGTEISIVNTGKEKVVEKKNNETKIDVKPLKTKSSSVTTKSTVSVAVSAQKSNDDSRKVKINNGTMKNERDQKKGSEKPTKLTTMKMTNEVPIETVKRSCNSSDLKVNDVIKVTWSVA